MKLRLPLLLAAAVMACYSHVSFGADPSSSGGFSINICTGDSASVSGTDEIGMVGVQADNWFNWTPAAANTPVGITKDNAGAALSGVTISTTRTNTWGPGSANKTTETDKLLSTYLDAGASDTFTITIAGVPYLSSTLYLIMSGDGGTFSAENINGTNWTYKDGAMVEGTEAWGNRSANQGALTLGTNVLQIDNIAGGSISITNVRSAGRGTIAGIQVVDTYEGTYLYRTLDSTGGAWSDALWSETDGTTGTLAWGGAGNGAVLKADAGGSTLTLSGTVVSDGVILQSGKLILSGGTLNMTGPAAFVTGQASTIKFDGTTVTSSGTLVLSGSGTYEISDLLYLPLSVDVTGGTLNVSAGATVRDGSTIRFVNSSVLDSSSLTIESGGSVRVGANIFNTLKVDSVSGSGELALDIPMGFDKENLPDLHSLLEDFDGMLTLGSPGEYYFNYTGSTDFSANILIGKEGMTVHVEKGATFRLNPINSGSNTFLNDMILEAGSSFYKQDSSLLNLAGNILMNGNVTDSIIITGQWGQNRLFSQEKFPGKEQFN
ncbi:hypothetical protein QET40_07780 [Akkermansia sp. N21169]|uniref:hypothetical protein n=1 Tax=Akkermansia sp. N21169 TaxID=3040765 RepID=UPI00244E9592|nr:hypothetical protein [Akkermansia sp. N21169]MDH3069006.1 hypothetical protein [Akkermansia sp. N21169]